MQRKTPSRKKRNIHVQYHQNNKNKAISKTSQIQIDRRTIQGRERQKQQKTYIEGGITYNIEINKWTCNTCGKNMAHIVNKMPYNMHAITLTQLKRPINNMETK